MFSLRNKKIIFKLSLIPCLIWSSGNSICIYQCKTKLFQFWLIILRNQFFRSFSVHHTLAGTGWICVHSNVHSELIAEVQLKFRLQVTTVHEVSIKRTQHVNTHKSSRQVS